MASEFTHVRRRPTRVKHADAHRDSNLIRASVLETALELGFTQNSTVADWIFNNPLSEEVEEHHSEPDNHCRLDTKSIPVPDIAEDTTPTFTSGSNSISDESSSLNSPGNYASRAAVTAIQVHTHKPSLTESPHVNFGDFPSDQLQLFSPFALSPHDVYHVEPEGSSLAKLPKDNERSRSQDDSLSRNPSPGSADAGYTSEGQYLSKGKPSKSKGNSGKSRGNKGSRPKVIDNRKTTEKDPDYASDGGYLSASSNKSQGKSPSRVKSRAMAFFRRRPKKAASDDEDEDIVPPVPALPILPGPSSPKLLERRMTPSSPPRSGFSPLTLNVTSPPASPGRRRLSKSPPAHGRATPPQRLDHISVLQRPASPLVTSSSAPTILTPAAAAATLPLPPSAPTTPLSTTSFSTSSTSSTQLGGGTGSTQKSLTASSSRQHLSIPPPAPPPTLPLPQPPPSPSTSTNGMFPPLPPTPPTPSRRGAPTRPIPMMPMSPGSTQPPTPGRTASPFRPLLSSRTLPPAVSRTRNDDVSGGFDGDQLKSKEFTGRQRSVTAYSAGLGGAPAFLQRKIQHGPPPSPRHPPPDAPLPPSPCLAPSIRPRTPIGSPSKFHEHFSSVSSVPLSQILSTPASMSPVPSTATLSESSSGPSIRSSHISSVSGRSEEPAIRDSSNVLEYPRPETSASSVSESSYGRPITSTLSRPVTDLQSQFSGRSDVSSSIYSPTTHGDSSSVTTYDADDADADDALKSCVDEEDDDASVYTSDDKTAGRRTMYLVEHGEPDENGDEIVIDGGRYWGHQVPPPLPPLPAIATRPGPGYF